MKEKIKIAFAHNNINHNTEGLMAGLSEYVRDKGNWQLIVWPDSSQESLEFLKQRGCKGAFVSTQTAARARELLQLGIPVIAVYSLQDMYTLPFISANSELVAKMACEYFIKKKFKNFAFFGITQARWSLERMEHFVKYVGKAGYEVNVFKEEQIPIKNDFIPFTNLWINKTLDTGQERLIQWLRQLSKPTAIFASCDILACYLSNIAKEAGLNIPDEISVLGVNNDNAICNICDPPLSSIALNFKKAGYDAARLLNKIILGQQKMQGQWIEIQPTHVESRISTDLFAVDNQDIVQVLKYIRQNNNKPLQVEDVANYICMSKRSLQLKFRKTLGRSIHDEIIQAHFDIAKAMLIDTNLSVDEIATSSGFLYTSNMRRAFRQIAGMLPQKYRQLHHAR